MRIYSEEKQLALIWSVITQKKKNSIPLVIFFLRHCWWKNDCNEKWQGRVAHSCHCQACNARLRHYDNMIQPSIHCCFSFRNSNSPMTGHHTVPAQQNAAIIGPGRGSIKHSRVGAKKAIMATFLYLSTVVTSVITGSNTVDWGVVSGGVVWGVSMEGDLLLGRDVWYCGIAQ